MILTSSLSPAELIHSAARSLRRAVVGASATGTAATAFPPVQHWQTLARQPDSRSPTVYTRSGGGSAPPENKGSLVDVWA